MRLFQDLAASNHSINLSLSSLFLMERLMSCSMFFKI